MNYLLYCPLKKSYLVISKATKDLSNYIGKSTLISFGNDFYKVIQEIEIR